VVTRENGFHPIREYLNDLKWDGTLRVEKWLSQYLGAEHNEYSRHIGRMVLISMIARVLEPGCKVDNSLVLEAPQGAGKSTVAKILAGGDTHFSDSLCDDLSSKDAMHHLAGKWIVEMAELSQFNKSDQTALKKFLTKTHDKFRPAYGRKEVSRARQCIFIGTTNEHKYLKDSTGNRRYWPIKCGHINLDLLRAYRDQLLAEALILYRADDSWFPTREFEAKYMVPEQDARYDRDVWFEQVEKWLEGIDHPMTVLEILTNCLGLHLDSANNAHGKRIVGILQALGWVPGRSMKAKFWIRK
jgi:predicted P-loop ATPase